MNRNGFTILLLIFIILFGIEVFNSYSSFVLLLIGVILFTIGDKIPYTKSGLPLTIGIILMIFAALTTKVAWIFLILIAIILISRYPDFFAKVRDAIAKKATMIDDDFVLIRFDQANEKMVKNKKQQWMGLDDRTEHQIYEWEDVNFTKLFGNTVIDIGNTILPKGENVILIQQIAGKTKILVPKEADVSMNIAMLAGNLVIGEDELLLRNEKIMWSNEAYQASSRKLKVVINQLLGEVQVIFI